MARVRKLQIEVIFCLVEVRFIGREVTCAEY